MNANNMLVYIGRSFLEVDAKEVTDSFSMGKTQGPELLTIDEKAKEYKTSKWCFDTPGVVQPDQILNILTTEELLLTIPKQMIIPRTFLIKPDMSLFLAGLGRVDYLSGCEPIRLTVYASNRLPILIVPTENAEKVYQDFLGTDVLAVPRGEKARLDKWPMVSEFKQFSINGRGTEVAACGNASFNCNNHFNMHY